MEEKGWTEIRKKREEGKKRKRRSDSTWRKEEKWEGKGIGKKKRQGECAGGKKREK